jgi:hypothetical protein
MSGPHLHTSIATAALVVLASAPARAQAIATSFDELRPLLEPGRAVVVTDVNGRRTRGTVADVSPTSLVLLGPDGRTYGANEVDAIRTTPDSPWSGALWGAAVGAGLATGDYLVDPSEPGNAAIFAAAIGLGAAIGAGIDALVNRHGRLLYAPPRRQPRVRLAPVLSPDRRGALLSIDF